MSTPPRLAIALTLLGAGMLAGDQLRALGRQATVGASRIAYDMAGLDVALVGLAVAVAWVLPWPVSDTLGLRRGKLPAGAVAALVVGTLGLSHAIDSLLVLTRTGEGSVVVSVTRAMRTASTSHWTWLVTVLGSVVAPAVCEELFCRGLVQRTAARAVGPALAIGCSAAVFGVLHMEWTHGLIAAALGVYLGAGAWAADSTRPAILAHGANNLAAVLGSQGVAPIRAPLAVSAAVGLALAGAGLLWIWHAASRRVESEPLQQPAVPSDP